MTDSGSTNSTSSSQTFEAGSSHELSYNDCDNISDSESNTEENKIGHNDPLFKQIRMHIPFHVPVSVLSATAAEEHASALKDLLISYAILNFKQRSNNRSHI